MNLLDYYEKQVKVVTKIGNEYIGFVDDYVYADDNESEMESIIVVLESGGYAEFDESNIKTIDIINN